MYMNFASRKSCGIFQLIVSSLSAHKYPYTYTYTYTHTYTNIHYQHRSVSHPTETTLIAELDEKAEQTTTEPHAEKNNASVITRHCVADNPTKPSTNHTSRCLPSVGLPGALFTASGVHAGRPVFGQRPCLSISSEFEPSALAWKGRPAHDADGTATACRMTVHRTRCT